MSSAVSSVFVRNDIPSDASVKWKFRQGVIGTFTAWATLRASKEIGRALEQYGYETYGKEFSHIKINTKIYGLLSDSYLHYAIRSKIVDSCYQGKEYEGLETAEKLVVDVMAGAVFACFYKIFAVLFTMRQLPSWKDLGKIVCYGASNRVVANLFEGILSL